MSCFAFWVERYISVSVHTAFFISILHFSSSLDLLARERLYSVHISDTSLCLLIGFGLVISSRDPIYTYIPTPVHVTIPKRDPDISNQTCIQPYFFYIRTIYRLFLYSRLQGNNIHRLDRSPRAIITLRLGLENDKVPMETLSKTASMEIACVWSIYAADRLWDNVRYMRTYSGIWLYGRVVRGSRKGSGRVMSGADGMLWVERLRAARTVCDDGRMRGVIGEALGCTERAMERCD